MDTTYFRRTLGVTVFRDYYQRENLLWKFVKYETIFQYIEGIRELQERGFEIKGIVTDGRRGIFKVFSGIPIQMCQFHQLQIVRRYLTNNPKLEAGIELKRFAGYLTTTDRESFEGWINGWYKRWEKFLKEKTINLDTGKWVYTHRKLRSAYSSLKTNMEYLFTCHKYKSLEMPNTTNSLDGSFAHLKDKVRIHRGLKLERKKKLIAQILLRKINTKL